MKTIAVALLALATTVMSQGAPAAAVLDETFKGVLVCAKCELKRPDAKECQDVLMVPDLESAKAEYYITKNEVAEASGEACTFKIKATVTGTVAKGADNRLWLTATKIEKETPK